MLHLIQQLKQYRVLKLFTIYLRYVIGAVFIVAAIKLIQADHVSFFNAVPTETNQPSSFFVAFLTFFTMSSLYWQGFSVVLIIAGISLLTQRYASLGALFLFVMMMNILVLTRIYGMEGTSFVTGFLLFATAYLLVWDAHYFSNRFVVSKASAEQNFTITDDGYWTILGSIMVVSLVGMTAVAVPLQFTLLLFMVQATLGYLAFYIRNRKRQAQLMV